MGTYLKTEPKEEVKEEPQCKEEHSVKRELKQDFPQAMKQGKFSRKRLVVKSKAASSSTQNHAAKVKSEYTVDVKTEVKEEYDQVKEEFEVKEEYPVKTEPTDDKPEEEEDYEDYEVSDEYDDIVKWKFCDPKLTYLHRLPLFLRQCIDFQLQSRTWSPARPCPFTPPPAHSESCRTGTSRRQ